MSDVIRPSDEKVRRRAPFACGFCGRNYTVPGPRGCCERGRSWDIGIEEARVAVGKAIREVMKS